MLLFILLGHMVNLDDFAELLNTDAQTNHTANTQEQKQKHLSEKAFLHGLYLIFIFETAYSGIGFSAAGSSFFLTNFQACIANDRAITP